jgi:hypothetical protein
MEFVIVLAILALVVIVVSAPLRRAETSVTSHDLRLAELEAARAAKYREIRDAELDHRTGKLSDADFAELDRELRGEAIDILRELDDADGRASRLPSEPT